MALGAAGGASAAGARASGESAGTAARPASSAEVQFRRLLDSCQRQVERLESASSASAADAPAAPEEGGSGTPAAGSDPAATMLKLRHVGVA